MKIFRLLAGGSPKKQEEQVNSELESATDLQLINLFYC